MGQSNNKSKKNHIVDTNGLVLDGKLIPEEFLVKILEYVDFRSLITCRLVCKKWNSLIKEDVMKKKIENIICNPPVDEKTLWKYFHVIWGRWIPYGKDLIKYNQPRWIFCDWGVPVGSWKNIHDMGEYSTHYMRVDDVCWKQQDVDLNEWFPQYILDNIKPTMIKIWDFYFCGKDSSGKYECKIELIKSEKRFVGKKAELWKYEDVILDSYNFSKSFERESERGWWYKLSHVFVNYEKGVNKIRFYHDWTKNVRVGGTALILIFPSKRKVKQLKSMGQSNTKSKKNQIIHGENSHTNSVDTNGLLLDGKLIPEEFLVKILEYVDFRSLITCRFVCKKWYSLIKEDVMKKKIQNIFCNPSVDEQTLWKYFHVIWGHRIPYGKDLIKYKHPSWLRCEMNQPVGSLVGSWKNVHDLGEYSSHYLFGDALECWKQQDIDLNEWFPQYILDNIKPTMIKIWDFYICEKDRSGKYDCKIELIKSENRFVGEKAESWKYKDVILDSYSFSKSFEKKSDHDRWYKLSHLFVNYEKGLNKIRFYHDWTKNVHVAGTALILIFPCKRKVKQLKLTKI